MLANARKDHSSPLYLENICGAEQPQRRTTEDELNIDGGKHAVAMFLN